MRRSIQAHFQILLFALICGLGPGWGCGILAYAQAPPHTNASRESVDGKPEAAQPAGTAEKSEASETDEYRHSATVQFIARTLKIPVETAAKTFEYLNFGVLAAAILYFIFKLVPKMFRGRRQAIAKQLVDARSATEQANERLGGVEARLSRIDDEIASIRRQVEQDAAQDEMRIKAALEEDKKRIAEAAGHEVETAGTAAQRELRRFAAELAIERAASSLSLTPEIDRRLVSNFAGEIVGDASKGGRN